LSGRKAKTINGVRGGGVRKKKRGKEGVVGQWRSQSPEGDSKGRGDVKSW